MVIFSHFWKTLAWFNFYRIWPDDMQSDFWLGDIADSTDNIQFSSQLSNSMLPSSVELLMRRHNTVIPQTIYNQNSIPHSFLTMDAQRCSSHIQTNISNSNPTLQLWFKNKAVNTKEMRYSTATNTPHLRSTTPIPTSSPDVNTSLSRKSFSNLLSYLIQCSKHLRCSSFRLSS